MLVPLEKPTRDVSFADDEIDKIIDGLDKVGRALHEADRQMESTGLRQRIYRELEYSKIPQYRKAYELWEEAGKMLYNVQLKFQGVKRKIEEYHNY